MLHDIRYALRSFLKTPGFTFIAVLTLALGIGANTAVFSVVNALLLQPLPYRDQQELVFIGENSEQVPNMSVAYPNFLDWRTRNQSFNSLGAMRFQSFNFVGREDTERTPGAMFSHDLLTTLGVQPILGRAFTDAEDRPGAERTLLLSERFWKREFGGQPHVLAEKVTLSGELYTVIGVLPASFEFPAPNLDIFVPLGLFADNYTSRGMHPGIYVVGRMKPNTSIEAARTDLMAIAQQLAQEHPQTNTGNSVTLMMLSERALGSVRPALLTLFGAAAFVLLIACANVANLLLARAAARSRELVVRAALGASRARLMSQLLLESGLLGIAGAIAGVGIAAWTIEALKAALPDGLPNLNGIQLSTPVLIFAIVAGVGTSVLFGLFPAFSASRVRVQEALASSGRGYSRIGRGRVALITGEFALTLALLVGAGLMVRTLSNIYAANPGFSTDRLLTFSWIMPGRAYSDPDLRIRQLDRALEKLAQLPGVTSVGLITPLPMSGGGNQNTFIPEGMADPGPGRFPSAETGPVNPDFFSTMRIPLLAGRTFTPADRKDAPPVVIIDETFAEKFFPNQDPLGKRVAFGLPISEDNPWMEIVGVVGHIQNYAIGEETRYQLYQPHTQVAPSAISFVVRTEGDPALLSTTVRHALREVDPALPVFGVRTMNEVFTATIATQKLALTLLGVFAGLALVLASIGLYGVLSYSVSQRTREIGVRMAIGADSGKVVSLVLFQGLKLAAFGLVIGLGLSLVLVKLLQSQLYEVSAFDPVNFISVAAILLLVGSVACWIPAWRATRVNPVDALRAD
jgi:predicted permease